VGQTDQTIIIRPFTITHDLEVLVPAQEFLEHDPNLEPRQIGP
jgi:hypothetical protein